MLRRSLIVVLTLLTLTSCEITKALWEDAYTDTINRFLVSVDGNYVVFIGAKYHYIFRDNSGIMKELLELDRTKVILLDPEGTELEVNKQNEISGHIGLKTFDLDLTTQQQFLLHQLEFKLAKNGEELLLHLPVLGKRYRGFEEQDYYVVAAQDRYEINIRHTSTLAKDFEKVALTPITIIADTLFLSKEMVLAPFGE